MATIAAGNRMFLPNTPTTGRPGIAIRKMAGRSLQCCGFVLAIAALSACGQRAGPAGVQSGSDGDPTIAAGESAGNILRMTIDDREWVADQALFGAVHPPGYDRAILMAGSFGPKDRDEQAFTINLYGIDAPGIVHVVSGSSGANVAQLSNPAPGLYLAGGVLGHDMQVDVLAFDRDPVRIEARFQGTLTANDDTRLHIRDGFFSYAASPKP
jgi:hypothetical protein